jgi:NADP-dependent 3-hydroxy acid dehydrogenase YdfG
MDPCPYQARRAAAEVTLQGVTNTKTDCGLPSEGKAMSTTDGLANRVAVITGASSGMGEATARRLAGRGAAVALLARRAGRLEKIANEIIDAGGTAVALVADVTEPDTLRAAAQQVKSALGTTSILFNNAGIMLPAPFEATHAAEWQDQIELNDRGVVNVVGAFVDQLIAAAADGSPSDLINTSSVVGRVAFPGFAVYGASKAFVTHFSLTLRTELGPKGVRVSALEPGLVDTELYEHVSPDVNQQLDGTRRTYRWLTAEDIAEIVDFTVSLPASANLQQITVMPTGQV